MNLLLYREAADGLEIPDFGPEFAAHIEKKRHPNGRRSSITAWNLLARGLAQLGYDRLPNVRFEEKGRPVFTDAPLHFSISHSSAMAAVLISAAPCAVDIEQLRTGISDRMIDRCLSDTEKACGCGFTEAWTQKECIVKLDGSGMSARPSLLDTLTPEYEGRFFSHTVRDSAGKEYILTALCKDGIEPHLHKE